MVLKTNCQRIFVEVTNKIFFTINIFCLQKSLSYFFLNLFLKTKEEFKILSFNCLLEVKIKIETFFFFNKIAASNRDIEPPSKKFF